MDEISLVVPDALGKEPEVAEQIFTLLTVPLLRGPIRLDMAAVTWIQPYGAVSLHGVCRYLKQFTQKPVLLSRLREDIHAYLRRIDFFACEDDLVSPLEEFRSSKDFGRSRSSSTVLELFPVRTSEDVYKVASRGRQILTSWLQGAAEDINRIVSLVAEACSNVVDHSGDVGIVMIQKYDCDRGRSVDIKLAISDLGKGIRQSLQTKYGAISDTSSGFIEKALDGFSARPGERGGQGLDAIRRIATASGGTLHIRSERGSVQTTPAGRASRDDLPFFPGTQIAITFRSLARG